VVLHTYKIPLDRIPIDDVDSILTIFEQDEKILRIFDAPKISSLRRSDILKDLDYRIKGIKHTDYGENKFILEVLPEFEPFKDKLEKEYILSSPSFSSKFYLEKGVLYYENMPVIQTKDSSTRKVLNFLWKNKELVINNIIVKSGLPQTIKFLGKSAGYKNPESARDIIEKWQKKLTIDFRLPVELINRDGGYLLQIKG
jgi:hypothetical protein